MIKTTSIGTFQSSGSRKIVRESRINEIKHIQTGKALHVHEFTTGIGRLVGENRWMSTEVVTLHYKIYEECNRFRIKIWHDYHQKSTLKMQSNQYYPT